MKHIRPYGKNVLVSLEGIDERTAAGLHLVNVYAQENRPDARWGTVIGIGHLCKQVRPSDRVLVNAWMNDSLEQSGYGGRAGWDHKVLVNEDDVFAVDENPPGLALIRLKYFQSLNHVDRRWQVGTDGVVAIWVTPEGLVVRNEYGENTFVRAEGTGTIVDTPEREVFSCDICGRVCHTGSGLEAHRDKCLRARNRTLVPRGVANKK